MKKAPITVPHRNTLIRIKYVAYISELTEEAWETIKSSCSKTFKAYIQSTIQMSKMIMIMFNGD